MSDGLCETPAIVTYKLFSSINHNLRCVYVVERKLALECLLTQINGVELERIAPAFMVPVGNVFAEHDRLCAGDWLRGVELSKQRVGRWAIGAAFRGKQLHKNGLATGRHG